MTDERKTLLQKLSDLGQEMMKAQDSYESENNLWWNSLTETEREDAFYAVVKRIYQGEIEERGTYRHILYTTFGFDAGMYGQGMSCGFMELHNIIGNGEDYQAMRGVNRIEVASDNGQSYVKYLAKDERIRYHLQDDNKTLKIFTDKVVRMKLDDQRD